MKEYLAPGVYVEEVDSCSHIAGVSAEAAGFVGLAERGPVGGLPVRVSHYNEFRRIFGGYLPESQLEDYRFLAYAVESFFLNGGAYCYISRVVPKDARPASCVLGGGQLKLTAKSPGAWGNKVEVNITPSSQSRVDIIICRSDSDVAESYSGVSFHANDADYIGNRLKSSNFVTIETNMDSKEIVAEGLSAYESAVEIYSVTLSGGSDGSTDGIDAGVFLGTEMGAGKHTGLQAFLDNTEVSILAIPGITDLDVQLGLIDHCGNADYRFAILDLPKGKNSESEVKAQRDRFDSPNAAIYHPWIQIFDSLLKKKCSIPPSGAIAGIYTRCARQHGIHKAPANEIVHGCIGLECLYSKGDQDRLNPMGVNLIRLFPGEGFRVWGARTCSSDGVWRYINVRRLLLFLEASIREGTTWVRFEPNDQNMWGRVTSAIETFLTNMWRGGALTGTSPGEAFFVKADLSTMTLDDVRNKRFVCLIGVAVVKPAEFITFRIMHKTNELSTNLTE